MVTWPSPAITRVFVTQRADVVAALAGTRNVKALQRRVIADIVGSIAVGDLPDDVAAVQD